jgi:S1-C subfamily serine protease
MGARVLDAQRTYPDRAVVVLAGTGHVLYGLGIARQLPRAQRLSAVTIMPIPIAEGAAGATVSASVGDVVWGIVESAHPAYPELGVLTSATTDGLRVIFVEPDSPAATGGIATGDLLTHYEGRSLTDRTELARGIASARWGDEVAIALRRDDATRVVRIALRRRTGD